MADARTPEQRRNDLHAKANGTLNATPNGTPNGTPRAASSAVYQGGEDDEQTDENIFLFVPNLIGKLSLRHTPAETARSCIHRAMKKTS